MQVSLSGYLIARLRPQIPLLSDTGTSDVKDGGYCIILGV